MTDQTGRPRGLGVVEIAAEECWERLANAKFGRLAVIGGDGQPDIFPVNHGVRDGRLVFRSAAGGKLDALTRAAVAFEVDGEEPEFWWSVVVRGRAMLLENEPEILASGSRDVVSWSPTTKYRHVQIDPSAVTGRKFLKRSAATMQEQAEAARDPFTVRGLRDESQRKPRPIPHQRPPL